MTDLLVAGLAVPLAIGVALALGTWLIQLLHRVMDKREERQEDDETSYDVDPAGLALAGVGAAAMALGAFLPLDQPGGQFAYVQSNSLIQHGGWTLIALGAGVALDGFRCYQTGKRSWGVCAMGAIGLLIVIGLAESKGLRTLYPIGTDGQPDQSAPGTVVPLGIAVYVSGAGAALAAVGGWVLHQRATIRDTDDHSTLASDQATKCCPDCAEAILADARVCKHCGYRFDVSAQTTMPGHESSAQS